MMLNRAWAAVVQDVCLGEEMTGLTLGTIFAGPLAGHLLI